eukprot:1327035-Amorphochlora_amoeboformis.AAC.2
MHRDTIPLVALATIVASLVALTFASSRTMTSDLGLAAIATRSFAPRIAVMPTGRSMCQRQGLPSSSPRLHNLRMMVTEAPIDAVTAEPEAAQVSEDEGEMEVDGAKAHLRFIRGSVHKYRRVVDTIRGRSYEEALAILQFMPYRACENVLKGYWKERGRGMQ